MCDGRAMTHLLPDSRMHRRVLDALYVNAMVLADEARSYFDHHGRGDREALDPMLQVAFSCESLKVTTRLMHVISWLLTQRAVESGEIEGGDALDPSRRLAESALSDPAAIAAMPATAQRLIAASRDLHDRVARLDAARSVPVQPLPSPVHSLQGRLARVF